LVTNTEKNMQMTPGRSGPRALDTSSTFKHYVLIDAVDLFGD